MAARKLHIFTAIVAEAKAIEHRVPPDAELTVIGIGAGRFPSEIDATAIILAGFAGALDPNLGIGDIVYDDPPGSIFTAGQIISTPGQKADLFRQTGAKAVDMENAIVRRFADRLGVPFYGVRAISDTAGQALDPAFLRFLDDRGRVKPAAMARVLLQKPTIVPELIRLGTRSRIAGKRLAMAVGGLIEQLDSRS